MLELPEKQHIKITHIIITNEEMLHSHGCELENTHVHTIMWSEGKNTPREKSYGTNGLTPPDPKLLLICKNDGYF